MPASDFPTSLATIADNDLVTIKRDYGDGNFIPLEVTGAQLKDFIGTGGGGNPVDEQSLGGATPPMVTSTKYILRDTDSGFMWYSPTKSPPWSNF